jgi:hypothetical protein
VKDSAADGETQSQGFASSIQLTRYTVTVKISGKKISEKSEITFEVYWRMGEFVVQG